jgi:hypothetical protein
MLQVSVSKDTQGCANRKSRIGWLFIELEPGKCGGARFNVNGARLKATATLRSRAAGAQDESRRSAIHRCNGNVEFLTFFGFLELGELL